MKDSENNNWIISGQLENIYEIYVNLDVLTTLLKFNHF